MKTSAITTLVGCHEFMPLATLCINLLHSCTIGCHQFVYMYFNFIFPLFSGSVLHTYMYTLIIEVVHKESL